MLCTLRQNIFHSNIIFLIEKVSQKLVNLEYIDTKEQIAGIFTKALPGETFSCRRQKLGVIPHH